jgi:hypothetical protein
VRTVAAAVVHAYADPVSAADDRQAGHVDSNRIGRSRGANDQSFEKATFANDGVVGAKPHVAYDDVAAGTRHPLAGNVVAAWLGCCGIRRRDVQRCDYEKEGA